jgi:hypothetical protein
MKRLALLSWTIATLLAPIQLQAQQYDARANCVRFPEHPNPDAELRYLLAHPNVRVCPSANPDLAGQNETVRRGMNQGYDNTMRQIDAMRPR